MQGSLGIGLYEFKNLVGMDEKLFCDILADEPTFLPPTSIMCSAEDLWLLADLPETKSCAKQAAASDRVKN